MSIRSTHSSHDMQFSMSSVYDYYCKKCNITENDYVRLQRPCGTKFYEMVHKACVVLYIHDFREIYPEIYKEICEYVDQFRDTEMFGHNTYFKVDDIEEWERYPALEEYLAQTNSHNLPTFIHYDW